MHKASWPPRSPEGDRERALFHTKFVRSVSMDTAGDLNPVASLGNSNFICVEKCQIQKETMSVESQKAFFRL